MTIVLWVITFIFSTIAVFFLIYATYFHRRAMKLREQRLGKKWKGISDDRN